LNKKYIFLLLVILIFACGFVLCSGSHGSIVGTWAVVEYDNGEDKIKASKIGELYGEMANEFSKTSLIFTTNGNLTLIRPDMLGGVKETKIAYTVQDGYVEIYDPDNPKKSELLEYADGKIRIEVSGGLTAILEKK